MTPMMATLAALAVFAATMHAAAPVDYDGHPFVTNPAPVLKFQRKLAPATTNTLRVYFIGNSVTDTVRYGELAKLAAARDVKLDWGRTMIPGAPLEWIYSHPKDGFQQEPFGRWT